MKEKIIKHIIFVTAILFLPVVTFAATVYLDSAHQDISVGDIVVVNAKISSDGATLNTVEGNINIKSDGTANIKEISTAGSVLSYWLQLPVLSKNSQSISFVGGIPKGFNLADAAIFKIVIEAKKEGDITFTPEQINAYLNDGKGTKVLVKSDSLTIHIKPKGSTPINEWLQIVGTDSTPPEPFNILIGQESTMFSGKKFAYFNATDNGSGIDHYEIFENDFPVVKSNSNTYILQNQDGNVKLGVIAYDKAGNKRGEVYSPEGGKNNFGINWLIAIIAVIILLIIYKKWRKNKQNVSTL